MTREIVVIGGGLAGAAMATHLARAGRDVLILERSTGPHDKVCGEFLSYEAQDELRCLGIDLPALGAVPIDRVSVERGWRRVEAALGFEARSLSRRALDEALLARAAEAGAEVRRGVRATALSRDGSGWVVEATTTIRARDMVLATGKHDLRGWKRPPGRQPDLVGLKMHWKLRAPEALVGRVELSLFPGGYAGLEPVEGGRANLCLVIRGSVLTSLDGRWEALLAHLRATCPGLASRLDGAEPCAARPLAVARVPYGFVQKESDGLWRIGDQAAVIPSFTGEGMSQALHGARLAATCLAEGTGPEAFQRHLARDLGNQVRRSTWASRALVSPVLQALAGRLLAPPLLRGGLRATRIPEAARADR